MLGDWMNLATSTALLAIESQEVIALRMAKLAKGDRAAQREAQIMVQEKFMAFGEAFANTARGGSSKAVVNLYRKKVRANRVRLAP